MAEKVRVALVQANCRHDIAANLAHIKMSAQGAAESGARLICTPENTCHMRLSYKDKLAGSLPEDGHPVLAGLKALARTHGVWVLIGSLSVVLPEGRMANRSFLLNDNGDIVAKYDKIHLFDATLSTGEQHKESAFVRPGTEIVVADTPWGKLGMSICYDLRFPYLYRKMAQSGAVMMLVPAAFTVPTGQAHWEVLLRARAIETGSFMLAPAQCGEHEGGRGTYGHSLIVGPWGEILAQGGDEPGLIMADLDMAAVEKARTSIPSLQHGREDSLL